MYYKKNLVISIIILWTLSSSCYALESLLNSIDFNSSVKYFIVAPAGAAFTVACLGVVARRGEDTLVPLVFKLFSKDYERYLILHDKLLDGVVKGKNEIRKSEEGLHQQDDSLFKNLSDLKNHQEEKYRKFCKRSEVKIEEEDLIYLNQRQHLKQVYPNPKFTDCDSYTRQLQNDIKCEDLVSLALLSHDKSRSLDDFKRQVDILSGVEAIRNKTPDQRLKERDILADRSRIRSLIKDSNDEEISIEDLTIKDKLFKKINSEIKKAYKFSDNTTPDQILDLMKQAYDKKGCSDKTYIETINNLSKSK